VRNEVIATREPRKLQRVLYQNCWRSWINNQVKRVSGIWPTYRILNRTQPFGNCIWFPPHLKRWTGSPATSITVIQSKARKLTPLVLKPAKRPRPQKSLSCLILFEISWTADRLFWLKILSLPTECENSTLKLTTTVFAIYRSQSYIHCYTTYKTAGKFVPLPKNHAMKTYRGSANTSSILRPEIRRRWAISSPLRLTSCVDPNPIWIRWKKKLEYLARIRILKPVQSKNRLSCEIQPLNSKLRLARLSFPVRFPYLHKAKAERYLS
jgi:hypothetical protein